MATIRTRSWLAVALGACALLLARPASAQSWEDLETRQATIAGIDIVVTDVFDLTQPADNTWLGRTANAIHVQTRRSVVAREILFAVGDRVDARRVHETERNLRGYTFIRNARVVPTRTSGAAVWARVEVFDAWSLAGGVHFSRAGGSTAWDATLTEANLAGHGKHLGVAHEANRERSANRVTYTDPQLFGSRWAVALSHSDLSDGTSRVVSAERPYYSVETPYAIGGSASRVQYSLTQYHVGDPVYAIPTRSTAGTMFGSWAHLTRARTAFRLGAAFYAQQIEFGGAIAVQPSSVPAFAGRSRRLRGAAATFGVLQDRSATFENLASIGTTEDYNLGWGVSGQIGHFARALGSTTSAPFGEVAVAKGWRAGRLGLIAVSAAAGGRHEAEGRHPSFARADVRAYDRRFSGHTLAANIQAASVADPDPSGWLYLDSTAGLRGYPDHFLAGDRRVVVSFDDRIITDWQLAGLLQVGFVGFADAGTIRRFDTGHWSRVYANLGGGLRLGSLKGGRNNIVLIAAAFPLVRDPGMDRVLLVLGNTVRF